MRNPQRTLGRTLPRDAPRSKRASFASLFVKLSLSVWLAHATILLRPAGLHALSLGLSSAHARTSVGRGTGTRTGCLNASLSLVARRCDRDAFASGRKVTLSGWRYLPSWQSQAYRRLTAISPLGNIGGSPLASFARIATSAYLNTRCLLATRCAGNRARSNSRARAFGTRAAVSGTIGTTSYSHWRSSIARAAGAAAAT